LLTRKHKQFFAMTAGALVLGIVALIAPHSPHPPQRAVAGQQARPLDPFTNRPLPELPPPTTCAEFEQYYQDSQKQWDTLAQHPGLILFSLLVAVAGLIQIARWMHTALRGLGRLFWYGWGWGKSVSATRSHVPLQ
jgi:hypothetical protein